MMSVTPNSMKSFKVFIMTKSVKTLKQRFMSLIDLMATPLTLSHYIELVNPLWVSHKLQAEVVDVWDETKSSRTLTLRPGRNWRTHRAGQYIRVGVPIDGKHFTRTYSISSAPERRDGFITITVKVLDGGRMSRHLVRNVKKGAYLPIGLPQGDFVLPQAAPTLPLFITAGSGITPIMSMLRNYAVVGNVPDIVHIHYAPHAYDVIFGKELKQYAEKYQGLYHYHPIFTRELGYRTSKERHFNAEQIESLCPDWRERDVWACGPQSLLDSLEEFFKENGREQHLHTERFLAARANLSGDESGGVVTFDEMKVEANGTTPLLRVLEDAGMNPDHGCRMGICRSCDRTLKSGRVRDLRTGAIIEESDSVVQICICAAAGDCELS
jgi:ferredoxin-NADP reductase